MRTILDLSVARCRVESRVPVQPSAVMELRIYVPDLDWPIMVDEAIVQWVKGSNFGVHFIKRAGNTVPVDRHSHHCTSRPVAAATPNILSHRLEEVTRRKMGSPGPSGPL